ncbi:lipase family protein [Sorangium sp. So ce136]|uniref:lipase family protein n=1 Tax=Sorangium sp. So ce136 TaxID=3133284 RepID=UPI003F03C913
MKIRGFMVPPIGSLQPRELSLIEQRMLQKHKGFDRDIATILAVLSSWSYASPEEFASLLPRVGLPGSQCAVLTLTNDAMLLETCAYIVQSWDKSTIILCFRGTPPFSATAWASNMAVELTPFYVGNVHSGFYSSLVAMWPSIAKLLVKAISGEDLCAAVEQVNEKDGAKECGVQSSAHGLSAGPDGYTSPRGTAIRLYVTGHSLGGALATLAAALLFAREGTLVHDGTLIDISKYQALLHGVYTFGAPKVGDPFFARVHQEKFGSLLFRMIHEQDFVTRTPTLAMGIYAHFGIPLYATDAGWVRTPPARDALYWLRSGAQTLFALNIALLARAFPFFRWFSAYQILSFDEHLPVRYMRTSLKKSPYAELQVDYRVRTIP